MRRALILLFVLLVPFKAIGAAVVPILGCPNHPLAIHAAMAAEATVQDHAAAHAGCEGMMSGHPAGTDAGLLDHGCPHLAMATVLPMIASIDPDRTVSPIDGAPARPLSSVVLDILLPPPL